MSFLFKNNDFKTDYKKRPFDSYKSVVDKLDEETKRKLDRQRTIGMACIVAFVVFLVLILYFTGIGVDKSKSLSGNVFADKEQVLIECFGDSLTEGYTGASASSLADTTYPEELETKLPLLFAEDSRDYKFQTLTVRNYGQAGSILQNSTCSRLSGTADIVIIQYTANNFLYGEDYEGTLEANIETIRDSGAQVFLLNYPVFPGSDTEDKIVQANNYIASTAKSMDVPLIDLKAYFDSFSDEERKDLFGDDRIHLTEQGYKLMGDQIAEFIHNFYFEIG